MQQTVAGCACLHKLGRPRAIVRYSSQIYIAPVGQGYVREKRVTDQAHDCEERDRYGPAGRALCLLFISPHEIRYYSFWLDTCECRSQRASLLLDLPKFSDRRSSGLSEF